MEKRKNKRIIAAVLLPMLLVVVLLSGCGRLRASTGTGTYFDTVVEIRIYDRKGEELLEKCFALCEEMEQVLSAQKEGSELWNLNHRTEQSVEVSEDLASCISQGLFYGDISDGAFDITILPLRDLWDFESKTLEDAGLDNSSEKNENDGGSAESRVPSDEDIQEALTKVDYRKVHVDGTTVTFDDPNTQIDLGGIAKGFISQKIKTFLQEEGCTSALINLGGNVSAVGTRPDGTKWVVGIQEPFADRGTIREKVELDGGSVISSGTYERYFEEGGVRYHHILDPHTGYPVVTSLDQATVIGEDDVRGDAFSTICILLGKDEASRIASTYEWKIELRFAP